MTRIDASDYDSSGALYAGYQYKIYKSTDGGDNWTELYTIPTQSSPWSLGAGQIFCLFVDSRDYIFASAGSTNRLYRSTDGGENFSEVLDLARSDNDGRIGFHQGMTEDDNGDLYASEYGDDKSARLYKSTDAGATWSLLDSWDARHIHAVRFNPYNNWLYVMTGEPHPTNGGAEGDTLYRSKDYGATWQVCFASTKSVPIEFVDDWVYTGDDRNEADDFNSIRRFQDDGESEPFTPTVVWTNASDKDWPASSCKVGPYMVFAHTSALNRTLEIVATLNGTDWVIVATYAMGSSIEPNYVGFLTQHTARGGNVAFVSLDPTEVLRIDEAFLDAAFA